MRATTLLGFCLLLSGFAAGAQDTTAVAPDTSAAPARVIRGIDVESGDVIPPWWEETIQDQRRISRWTYAALNALHVRTKPYVIERELLFSIGDTLNQALLDESERNLRAFPFISDAEINVTPADSNGARVRVRASDNFSLAAGWISESGGGSDRLGALVTEKNLFGLGKEIAAQYEVERNSSRGTTEAEWLFQYKDPRLAGSRFAMDLSASRGFPGNEYRILVARPFTTMQTRRAGGIEISRFSGRLRLWRDKVPVAELPVTRLTGFAWAAKGSGSATDQTRLQLGLAYRRTLHGDTPLLVAPVLLLPRDTVRVSRVAIEPSLTVSRHISIRFHKLRNLDDFDAVEDVEEGASAGLTGGFGVPSEPTGRLYGLGGAFAQWCNVEEDNVTAARAQVSSRLGDDQGGGRRVWSTRETSAFLHHYYTGLPWQTLALSVNWRSGARMDGPYQLLLGGDTGLRGYSANVFEGDRKVIINAENRVFTPIRVLVYRLGFVLFADGGYAWQPESTMDPRDMRVDVGAGFRIYNSKAATARVSRFDFAWNVRGQRGFMLSGGSEQLFDLFNRRPTPTR